MKPIKLVLATTVLLLLMPVAPAAAQSTSLATCVGSWDVSFSNGVGLVPQTSDFSTGGLTGTINCVGAVDGSPVTGPGEFGKAGTIEGSCLLAEGGGTIEMEIPTADGVKRLEFDFTMITGPGIGFKSGGPLLGPLTFLFIPTQGDCVMSPVTQIAVTGEFVLST